MASLSGREDTRDMHSDLEGKAFLVSGHHGYTDIDTNGRIIVDKSGGKPSDIKPIEAIILP